MDVHSRPATPVPFLIPAPISVEIDLLAERIAGTAAALEAACQRLLTDLRRFDDEQGWARHGALSTAH